MTSWSFDGDFVKAVHLALKRYHKERELGRHPLTSLMVVEELRNRRGWPGTPLGRAVALKEALDAALKALAERDEKGAALLEGRFWRGKSAVWMAKEQGVVESTFYARQERSIYALAKCLWEMEQAARRRAVARQRHLQRNLPPPTYTRLFGMERTLKRLKEALASPQGPWLISIEGLGGLGKTALAHNLASWAATTYLFADIAWVTARQQTFTTWAGIIEEARPTLTLETLLKALAIQLDCPDIPEMPPAQKEKAFRAFLKEKPYLAVIDNLETVADYEALVPKLWEMANPSRFIFTTRHSIGHYPYVLSITLNELEKDDSLALMRHEGMVRGITPLTEAEDATLHRIYAVTGGNPLAIKLVVEQARILPLERVLDKLREAVGKQYEDLYSFIYRRSWELLSEDARKVLLAMPGLAPGNACWANLQAATSLDKARLDAAIEELAGKSLLNVGGHEEKRYTIHRLTHTFIMSDLSGGW